MPHSYGRGVYNFSAARFQVRGRWAERFGGSNGSFTLLFWLMTMDKGIPQSVEARYIQCSCHKMSN